MLFDVLLKPLYAFDVALKNKIISNVPGIAYTLSPSTGHHS